MRKAAIVKVKTKKSKHAQKTSLKSNRGIFGRATPPMHKCNGMEEMP